MPWKYLDFNTLLTWFGWQLLCFYCCLLFSDWSCNDLKIAGSFLWYSNFKKNNSQFFWNHLMSFFNNIQPYPSMEVPCAFLYLVKFAPVKVVFVVALLQKKPSRLFLHARAHILEKKCTLPPVPYCERRCKESEIWKIVASMSKLDALCYSF